MPGPIDIQTVLANQDFQGLGDDEKQKFLSKYVPDFQGLPAEEQSKFISKYISKTAATQDPNQATIAPRERGTGEKIYNVIRNSAIGHAVEETMPKLADKIGMHPTDTVYNPDYQAHKEQMLAPEEMIDENQPNTTAGNAKRLARGGLKTVGGLTTGANMAMMVGAAMGAEFIPVLGGAAALNKLGTVLPGLASIVAKKGASYVFSRMIAAGFTADMVVNLIKQSPELGKAIGEGRVGDAWEQIGQMMATGYMAHKAGQHATGAGEASAKIGQQVELTPEGKGATKVTGTVVDSDEAHYTVRTPQGKTTQVPIDKTKVKVTGETPNKVSLAHEGALEKLGYSKEQINRLDPYEADQIVKHNVKPNDFSFRPIPQPPQAAAAAAGASSESPAGTASPVPPPPQPPTQNPVMELSAEQLTQTGQLTEGVRRQLDSMAYEHGFGSPDALISAVRDKASRGEELTEDDRHVLRLAENNTTVQTSAKSALDQLAYEKGYGNTQDYVRDVIKSKRGREAKATEDSNAELILKIANGEDPRADLPASPVNAPPKPPESFSPQQGGGESPEQSQQTIPPDTRANTDSPAAPSEEPPPPVPSGGLDEVRARTKGAIESAGLVHKGDLVFDDKAAIQLEHPDHPGFTTTLKSADVEGKSDKQIQQMARDRMRQHLIKNGRDVPEDLKTAIEKQAASEQSHHLGGQPVAAAYGRQTVIHTPNGDYQAVYRIVEANDMKPSHDAMTFAPNEAYPKGVQERRYHDNKNAQAEVEKYAQEGKWSLFVNNDPTAINGPSQSLMDGTVLGGNGRTMGLIKAYRYGKGDAYKAELMAHAADFGLKPEDIAKFKEPVLDRAVINAPMELDGLRRLGADLNADFKKKTSPIETAMTAGKSLRPESADRIGGELEKMGEDGSVRSLMDENPTIFRDVVLGDGILRQSDLPQYFEDDGQLNDTGKDFMENMLVAHVIRDSEILANMPRGLKDKIVRSLSPLMEVAGREDSWNIVPDVREAVRQAMKAAADKKPVIDFVRQVGWDDNGNPIHVDPRVADLAIGMTRKPTQVAKMFKEYAGEARANAPGQEGMFGAVSPDEAIADIFNPVKSKGAPASMAFPARATGSPKQVQKWLAQKFAAGERPYTEIQGEPLKGPVDELVNQTMVPAAKEAFRNITESGKLIRDTFAPGGQLKTKELSAVDITKLSIRQRSAELAAQYEQAKSLFADARKFFQRFDRQARMHILSMIDAGRAKELGQELGTPLVEQYTNIMRTTRERIFASALDRKDAPQQLMRPDYFLAHLYKTADGEPLAAYMARRPLEGAKSMFKSRKFPTMAEFQAFAKENHGVDVQPLYDNPVDFELAKIHEIQKFNKGYDIMQDLESNGIPKFQHALDGDRPEGYREIKDPVGTVYAPPHYTVAEAFDKLMSDRIDKLIDSLGVTHTRKVNIGGDGRWGYAEMGGRNKIASKVGGPLDVVSHELGHILDDRYKLAKQWAGDPFVKNELRALADLRYEGQEPSKAYKSYVREGTEKIANLVAAYVHNRAQAEDIAPNAIKYLENLIDQHEELAPLRDIKPSMVLGTKEYQVPTGTINILGKKLFPDAVANILDNHLSPGLGGNPLYRSYQFGGNFLNQVQLGMSAFHLMFVAHDSAVSTAALGIQQVLDGSFSKGFKSLAKGNIVTAPIEIFMRGNKLWKDFHNTPIGAEYSAEINRLIRMGGRVKMEDFYHNSAVQSFWDAFHGGNKLGAIGRWGVPAFVEEMAKPIMEDFVPRMKLGVADMLAEHEMGKLDPDASVWEQNAVLARAWDSVDNRLGQVVYDNLHWNRTLKDLLMASVRSLGWNLGTFREFGGAVIDLSKGVKRAVTGEGNVRDILTPRLAYAIALPIVIGIEGSILHYAMTGQSPEELKDYFFPKTGRSNTDGTAERLALPSYLKDIYNYTSGFDRGPTAGAKQFGTELSHKIHPMVGSIAEMLENKDFYGTEIRNPDDPAVKQLRDIGEYVVEQFKPFSVRNAQRRLESIDKGGSVAGPVASSFFGFTPASRSVDRTKAMQMAADYVADQLPRGSRSRDEFERTKIRNEVSEMLKLDDPQAEEKLKQAEASGQIGPSDMAAMRSKMQLTWLQAMTRRLNIRKALNVYDAATAEEKEQLAPIILAKQKELFSVTPEQRDEYVKRLNDISQDAQRRAAGRGSKLNSPMSQVPAPPSP